MTATPTTQILVVGSGAGGAVTALELAGSGRDVLILEEGRSHGLDEYGGSPTEAMELLYRRRGMTPLIGSVPIGYVEGCCVGGSTEINSGFWHRTPRENLLRWKARFDLAEATPEQLAPHFEWAESLLGVGPWRGPWPESTRLFARGIEAMGWSAQEVPRAAPGCRGANLCASGCPTGAKAGVGRTLVPRALEAGARLVTGCRAVSLLIDRRRVTGVLARLARPDGTDDLVRITAEHVFLCCGPTETAALLRRSGIRARVGETLKIHPMLKVAARFPGRVDQEHSVMPLLQVKEFWPEITLGGAFFSRGHLAMLLCENWPALGSRMADLERMAMFYVAVRGTNHGSVRTSAIGSSETVLRYELSREDHVQLNRGLSRLATLLLAAGADEVYPAVQGLPVISSELESITLLDEPVPRSALALMTVHAFSTCPMGEHPDRCVADSFGRVRGYENLNVNDSSMLPDSPGVNPQGTIMALARRNALHFKAERS